VAGVVTAAGDTRWRQVERHEHSAAMAAGASAEASCGEMVAGLETVVDEEEVRKWVRGWRGVHGEAAVGRLAAAPTFKSWMAGGEGQQLKRSRCMW
jgi:hypothetical protein